MSATSPGLWWISFIRARVSAGATLVVVYRDPRQPLRKIVVYDGLAVLPNTAGASLQQPLHGIYQSVADPQATLIGHKWPKLKIDGATQRVSVNGEAIELSTKENALLIYLDEHSDRICSKEELGKAVWPEYKGDVFDYQVESLIKRLRQKLEPDADASHLIVTVRGRGYRLIKP